MDYYDQFESDDTDVINSLEHQALTGKAAPKAIVLLENIDHTLPLDINKIGTIAVIGPNADLHGSHADQAIKSICKDYLGAQSISLL